MTLLTLLKHQGTIEALKQAIPADGATALRIRRALRPFSLVLEDYQKLVQEKLKSLGKTEITHADKEWPEVEQFLGSALREEVEAGTSILSEDDISCLRVPRKDGTMSGLSVAEIDGAEALGLLA